MPDEVPEKVTRMAAIVAERYGLHIRKLTRKIVRDEDYGTKLFEMVNRTYCDLFDFTVLPKDVMSSYVKTYLGLLDLKFVTVVEDNEGKLVAFSVSMPSIARAVRDSRGFLFPLGWWRLLRSMYLKHEEALELLLIAVDPDYRNKGVHVMLFNDLIPMLIQGGFKYGESNAEMETNNAVQNLWNQYRREFKRRRRVYSKEI